MRSENRNNRLESSSNRSLIYSRGVWPVTDFTALVSVLVDTSSRSAYSDTRCRCIYSSSSRLRNFTNNRSEAEGSFLLSVFLRIILLWSSSSSIRASRRSISWLPYCTSDCSSSILSMMVLTSGTLASGRVPYGDWSSEWNRLQRTKSVASR